ncbi:MAG: redoxin family protein [Gammaproteobacteria bacterium]|jgi:DsbE subfamily thiol:disulfide oxidoreductase|tara:strand:- start:9534 stop:10049 length:516 start_codon:yes stop_codon:yes gene_type:complete
MATRSFLVLMMALLVFLISTFTVSLMQTNEIALIENQEGKKLYISEDLYDLNGNKIAVESLLEGKVLLNVWASWCITCLVEHPFLKKVTESKDVNLVGINYKDQDFNAEKYLIDNGDPYSFSIYDLSGNFSLKLGVTGAPETFLVIDGVIVSHRIGEVNMEVWNEKFAQYF